MRANILSRRLISAVEKVKSNPRGRKQGTVSLRSQLHRTLIGPSRSVVVETEFALSVAEN